MRFQRWTPLLVLSAVLCLVSCGDDDGPAEPGNGNGTGNGSGVLSATIDGAAWTANVTAATGGNGVVIGIVGSNTSDLLGLGLGFPDTGIGAYTIGPGSIATGSLTNPNSEVWNANSVQGSGLITVTSVNATSVAGTFSFTATTSTGSTPATRVVTNGVFDLERPVVP